MAAFVSDGRSFREPVRLLEVEAIGFSDVGITHRLFKAQADRLQRVQSWIYTQQGEE
jgi:hypothetical protein